MNNAATSSDLVQVPLHVILGLRDRLLQCPEVQTSNMLHHIYTQVAQLYQELHKQLNGRLP